ncbi:MAG: oxidoreductase, partial [Symploca sp. SIO2E6]|nr:oxidoreductase [Symploca sp. SIO2E6]
WRKLQDTAYVRSLIAKTIPGYQKIGEIDRTQEEFTIDGRIFNEPKFATPSGRARMDVIPLPKLSMPSKESFPIPQNAVGMVAILGSGRSYGQHNTVVYRQEDQYRGMPHRYCIMLNPSDIKQVGFREHQRVTVQGDRSKLENIEIIAGPIRSGVAFMFYPEANCLFSATIDPQSGTPAFKRVPVAVYC